MKTGEYLTGDRPTKAPKPEKRPPSSSKTPVTPVKGKGPVAKIEPRPMPKPKPTGHAPDKNGNGGRPIGVGPKGSTDLVKAIAGASAAAKTGGAKGKPGKRIGGTKFSGLTPPGKFEDKGKGLG